VGEISERWTCTRPFRGFPSISADVMHRRDATRIGSERQSQVQNTIAQRHQKMPPKGSRKSVVAVPNRTLVLDNGGYTVKAGIVSSGSAELTYDDCTVIPNCIARSTRDKCSYTGSELDGCKDFGELAFRRPVEKGFIVNWEAEKAIWEHEFMGGTAGERLRVGAQLPQFCYRIEAHD
jgi:hypothetical protein